MELFRELEGQSCPVLKFEVEIRTLLQVGGCKLDLTLILLLGIDLSLAGLTRKVPIGL